MGNGLNKKRKPVVEDVGLLEKMLMKTRKGMRKAGRRRIPPIRRQAGRQINTFWKAKQNENAYMNVKVCNI